MKGKKTGGRKPGSRNKRTAEVIAAAAAQGQLPHEFLLSVSRGEKIGGVTPTFEQRVDAAKAAAPYYAPRLLAMAVKHQVTNNPFVELLALIDGSSRGRLPKDYARLQPLANGG